MDETQEEVGSGTWLNGHERARQRERDAFEAQTKETRKKAEEFARQRQARQGSRELSARVRGANGGRNFVIWAVFCAILLTALCISSVAGAIVFGG